MNHQSFLSRTSLLLLASSLPKTICSEPFDFEKIRLPKPEKLPFNGGDRGSLPHRLTNTSCKVFPGDALWPSDQQWASFNESLNGALIRAVPQAAPCYSGPYYDEAECSNMTANWTNSYLHDNDPVEMLSPVYQGLTCQPPTYYDGINSGNCTLGGYPSYVVNVTDVAQIQTAIKFAHDTGIRLVIRNTGHDFSGKSGGAGSLSIWTRNLKNITYYANYVDEEIGYSGPAFKAGSGLRAFEIYKAASEKGVVVVGGEGQTVGIMGGYIQGGGHSPLSSIYGTGADQVLEMQVVLANGTFVTASSSRNRDLFWALRGGGGGSFGVVTSVTVKAHPEMHVTSATFSWTTANVSNESFWQAVRAYLDYFPDNADAGTYSYWLVLPLGNGIHKFLMQPFFAPNKTLEETMAILGPWFDDLSALNISFSPTITQYTNFYEAWLGSFPLEIVEKTHVASGSRLFPRSNWANSTILNATFEAIRASSEAGNNIIAFNIAPTLEAGGNPDNAVNPAWRRTVLHAIQSVNWQNNSTREEIVAAREWFNNVAMKRWLDISPGAGSYLGESNRMEKDWQQSFYGSNYERLLTIKKAVDPDGLFWAATAVGSENWAVQSVDGLPNENGRLCRVS